ncbi:MAG: hypothetical protein MZV49_07840 [Rhodopseudomonas palustris]|nr:hypothetical protein [Rhodopseudomonas palustris]
MRRAVIRNRPGVTEKLFVAEAPPPNETPQWGNVFGRVASRDMRGIDLTQRSRALSLSRRVQL